MYDVNRRRLSILNNEESTMEENLVREKNGKNKKLNEWVDEFDLSLNRPLIVLGPFEIVESGECMGMVYSTGNSIKTKSTSEILLNIK